MNKQISNKISFFILCIVLSGALYYIYQNTFGNVWNLKAQYEELQILSESGKNYTYELEILNKRLEEANALIGDEQFTGGEIQQSLLTELNNLSDSLSVNVTKVPSPHYYKYGDFKVITGVFQLTGTYTDLIKTIDYLENDFKYATISSAHFYTEENYNNQSRKLFLEIYLQNISPNEK